MSVLRRNRVIREAGRRAARAKTESRTGLVWAVYPEQRVCEMRFQGAWGVPVTVQYPSNREETPSWLRVGAAVEVRHPAGNQQELMAVGAGAAIPTPEAGQTSTPTVATGANCVIDGCGVYVNTGMQVFVKPGTYRINDTYYSTDLWTMSAGSPVVMQEGSPLILGQVADVIQLSAASSSGFRFDLLCIGADKQIDYVVGTPDATNPVKPTLPAAHVVLGYILVPPGATEISQTNINQSFVAPMASALTVSDTDLQLTWATSSVGITVTVVDQYGRPMTGNWTISATILSGSGTVGGGSTGGTATTTCTYNRLQPQGEVNGEISPVFIEFKLQQDTNITNQTAILLEDDLGGLIIG